MADIELVIKIDEEDYKYIKERGFSYSDERNRISEAIANGTLLPDIEKMLSNLNLSMSYVLESDHRSFTNQETENGWIFDTIIEWRKMIQPYIKEED